MSTLLKILIITVIACLGMLFFSHFCLELNAPSKSLQLIVHYHFAFCIWRYFLYIVVLVFWPKLIEWIGVQQNWQAQTIIYLSNQRIKVFCFFVIIEVFFVSNVIGHLIAWL